MSIYQKPKEAAISPEYENDETILLTEIPLPMSTECVSSANEVEIANMESRFVPGRSRAADAVCLEPNCNFRCCNNSISFASFIENVTFLVVAYCGSFLLAYITVIRFKSASFFL